MSADRNTVVIGTRGSALALWQARWVQGELERLHPGLSFSLEIIKTTGDKILDVPLAQVGGKGLFVKEIEEALLEGRIDLAVHSMKDVPAVLPQGVFIAVVPRREDPRDVLVSRDGAGLRDLRQGARVGTSSLRRIFQLRFQRTDLEIVPLRGNIDTRLRKVGEGELDAVVLAAAGIRRMGWEDRITEYLSLDVSLPAVGQGALGIECRIGDARVLDLLHPLDDPETHLCVTAERAFLSRLEGGCQAPIAGHARREAGALRIEGRVSDLEGTLLIREQLEGSPAESSALGLDLAERLLEQGAAEILKEVYGRAKGSPDR
ncbi:MAG: hydroxymethylbilane synthase [Nitrospirae bacterium]|nr:hydroxymethylbilane synthase [Nitrospirota bacterium]